MAEPNITKLKLNYGKQQGATKRPLKATRIPGLSWPRRGQNSYRGARCSFLWTNKSFNSRIAIVTPTFGDGRDTCVEGGFSVSRLYRS